jgi:predicted NBD/HSP70 family sugar kinase
MKTRSLAAIPSSLRRLNERAVLRRLRRLGAASRASLAKEAGISQPTAGKIIDELLEYGLIEELGEDAEDRASDGAETPRLGRPGRLLRLDGVRPRFVGIELGVEQTCVSALPLAVGDESVCAAAFETGRAPETWARRLRQHAAVVSGESLWGVLASVPGVVDEAAGRVLYSPNLHWTERAQLVELIRRAWPLPVLLVQEIRALALGHLAAEPEAEDFLLVDFGEGVGGAVIEGGQLLSHPLPLSAELGHTPVLGNLRRCGCGARGCVETLLSRRGLAGSFGATNPAGSLAETIALHGPPSWLNDALAAMGTIIAGALNVLGLRRVVITGHLTELPPVVLATLADAVQRGAMWARFGEVVCTGAPRRRLAGLVAAGIDRLLFPAASDGSLHVAARRRMAQTARQQRRARLSTRPPAGVKTLSPAD